MDPAKRRDSSHQLRSLAPMPSFFETYDLVALLISALSESYGGESNNDKDFQTDLARLARTCKAFRDPPLDAHWRTMRGLLPIVKLFPVVLRVDELEPVRINWHLDCFVNSRALVLQDLVPLSRPDWDRIRFYTLRIRKLSIY
jgi:hypothetical protein